MVPIDLDKSEKEKDMGLRTSLSRSHDAGGEKIKQMLERKEPSRLGGGASLMGSEGIKKGPLPVKRICISI